MSATASRCRASAFGAQSRANQFTDEPRRPRGTIMRMLLIAALAVIWNLFGQ
jgi:hypothetical protein